VQDETNMCREANFQKQSLVSQACGRTNIQSTASSAPLLTSQEVDSDTSKKVTSRKETVPFYLKYLYIRGRVFMIQVVESHHSKRFNVKEQFIVKIPKLRIFKLADSLRMEKVTFIDNGDDRSCRISVDAPS
jgi:hypothetical protein